MVRSFRRPHRRRRMLAAVAGAAAALLGVGGPSAHAQVATMGKGHNLLLNSGLQIWGLNTDSFQYTFNYNNFAAMNLNAVMWSFGQSNPGVLTTGQKWGKWVQPNPAASGYTSPANSLNATETAHKSDLVAIQVGDEQQADLENPNGYTKAWFDAAHSGGHFTDKLMYINSTYVSDVNNFINFVAAADPDAISWDAYPFGTTGVYPYNWLGKAQIYRRVALGNYIGASGTAPRPYGLYLQTYHGGDGARDPGDLEMRWQQFTAWTLGYTFVDAFTAGGGNTSLFNSGNGNSPTQPRFDQFKETSRQSRNLGPALVRLISHGYGPSFVAGQDPTGATNPPPVDWPVFSKTNAPPAQQYLTSVSATNLGTKNNGKPGDVYVGFFNPLHASVGGGPAGEAYFMVTNALGAYLQDATLTPADCTQAITLNFDNNYSGVSSLQRLRRSDGQLEVVPLTKNANGTWTLNFNLEGGTGDLFKYNDGTPFVSQSWTMYWDNDNTGSNNNTSSGAGLGGTGIWYPAAHSKWYVSGTSNGQWQSPRDAVFMGTAGTVTLNTSLSANSLTFKTTGYTIAGNSSDLLTMAGPFITTDAGVTTTINARLAGTGGIAKAGSGTLILTNANTYSGGTTITGGTLRVSSDSNLGAIPGALIQDITLNGGTLQFGASFDIANTRAIALGPNGGTIDTQGFTNPNGYNATAGGFRGPGDLIKTGTGTFFAAATTGGANTTWTGRLILQEGTWKIVASDGLPYNVPAADGVRADQITLDGGTWQMGATINVTNGRRGITVTPNGGTIDTQGFNFTWAGPMAGSSTTATLNKIGSGTLTFTGANSASTYNGVVNVNEGTLQLNNGNTMGDLASLNVNAGLTINGNETIGSLAGTATGTTSINSGFTLTAGGNNGTTSFAGTISGAGHFAKAGTGTLTLSGTHAYTGTTTVSAGTLALAASLTSSSSLSIASGATARLIAGQDKVLVTNTIAASDTGKLDLTDNSAVVKNSTLTAVRSLIASGFNGGNWQGAGITSSAAAANPYTAVGVVSNGLLKLTSFEGVTGLDTNDVLVKYTYSGDADLSGATTLDDFTMFLVGYQQGGTTWTQGDFDYSGTVTLDDFSLFLGGYRNQGLPLSSIESLIAAALVSESERAAMLAAVSAVPEPSGIALALAAGASAAARRLRRPRARDA